MKIKPMYLVAAAGAYFVIKNLDSNGTTKPAATAPAAKTPHPVFTYPRTETLSEDQENELIKAIFNLNNLSGGGTLDGSPVTPEQYASVLALLDDAIKYYPNRPEKKMEEVKTGLVNYKERILSRYYREQNVGMGPISGFSGVY